MERLHSYWRMEYVEAPKFSKDENPFLTLPRLNNDRAAHIVHRGKLCFLILNRFPYNAGHLLVAPFREVANLVELSLEERTEFFELVILGQSILTQTMSPDGFNIGFNVGHAGGASIATHLHCHIVPRWTSDTNFMPVLADTRVLPKSLDNLWVLLHEACRAQSNS